jgi:hypothetical protein
MLKSPNKAVRWGIGSRQSIAWSSGMGLGAMLRVEVSRDGGASWTTIAPGLAYMPDLEWEVPGPPTAQGVVRVTWSNGPLSDTNDEFVVIEDPLLKTNGPGAATEWACGAAVTVKWTTNLGLRDRVNVRLSADGGATFPHLLAASIPATTRKARVTVPSVTTGDAIVRVESLDNPAWHDASAQRFKIRCGG